MIRQRMSRLRRELDQVRKTRTLHRERRGRAPWPVIALVGYTNAGKSTLFNRLTGAEVMAEDLLFATLDPTMRAISLPGVEKAILSDTVGFISDLPTQLVAAFRATLEEVTGADVICHVRDMANPGHAAQKKQVMQVLSDLGVVDPVTGVSTVPILEVWNKCDLLEAENLAELQETAAGQGAVILSAVTGEGVEALETELARRLTGGAREVAFTVPVRDGRRMAWLHAHGEVLDQVADGDHITVEVRLSDIDRWKELMSEKPAIEPAPVAAKPKPAQVGGGSSGRNWSVWGSARAVPALRGWHHRVCEAPS
jgi:GTP-binding protein HflX